MIITIDGPAGAGKSTVARMLARRMGFQFLDTGAMYRAVTWAALVADLDVFDHSAMAKLACRIRIEFGDDRVFVDGEDVSQEIRNSDVTAAVSEIADNPQVREHLVMLQREIASTGDFVCEGRDQGTIVFPDADCKIFLTATSTERAKRRFEQLKACGRPIELDVVLSDQENRDQRDLRRAIGKLVKADDAVEFISDGMTLDEVVDQIEEIARSRITS